jgi:signal transduction protein with GAF and PtsI domain
MCRKLDDQEYLADIAAEATREIEVEIADVEKKLKSSLNDEQRALLDLYEVLTLLEMMKVQRSTVDVVHPCGMHCC